LTGPRTNRTFAGATFGNGGIAMKWKTPVIIEIAVGLEINAYACAEV
jgi:coenzyme PQQ precursor peptide PqqA